MRSPVNVPVRSSADAPKITAFRRETTTTIQPQANRALQKTDFIKGTMSFCQQEEKEYTGYKFFIHIATLWEEVEDLDTRENKIVQVAHLYHLTTERQSKKKIFKIKTDRFGEKPTVERQKKMVTAKMPSKKLFNITTGRIQTIARIEEQYVHRYHYVAGYYISGKLDHICIHANTVHKLQNELARDQGFEIKFKIDNKFIDDSVGKKSYPDKGEMHGELQDVRYYLKNILQVERSISEEIYQLQYKIFTEVTFRH